MSFFETILLTLSVPFGPHAEHPSVSLSGSRVADHVKLTTSCSLQGCLMDAHRPEPEPFSIDTPAGGEVRLPRKGAPE